MPDGPLPKPPRRVSQAAQEALDLYARLYRRTPPLSPRRRRVLSGRLMITLGELSAKDASSYYAQLTRWRREDG